MKTSNRILSRKRMQLGVPTVERPRSTSDRSGCPLVQAPKRTRRRYAAVFGEEEDSMERKLWRHSALAVAAALAMASAGSAQTSSPPAAKSDVDPAAISALDKMGAYLRTLKVFRVETRNTRDEVLENGQKVQLSGKTALLVRRPDGLRANVESDLQDRMYFYDGKTFTLYAKRLGFYATAAAPPTLAQLADVLDTKYDIEIPLADLFLWGT